ncbi:MAG: EVE domain-containing protein [Bacteroidetes bacterium]|nr:EVE domain-containing protein [Bacteroidota bacterium]
MNNQMKYWIVTISKEHVLKGQEWEIMQVCHGKKSPLKRINKGDYVIFYSSKQKMKDKEPLQNFTAIAQATDDHIYQVKQFEGFEPFRRKVSFLPCEETSIRPMINDLEFIENKSHWGFYFRYGLVQIPEKDFHLIASKMSLQL